MTSFFHKLPISVNYDFGYESLTTGIFYSSDYILLVLLISLVIFSGITKIGHLWRTRLFLLSSLGMLGFLTLKSLAIINLNNLTYLTMADNAFLVDLTKISALILLGYFILMQAEEKTKALNFEYPTIVLIAFFGILLTLENTESLIIFLDSEIQGLINFNTVNDNSFSFSNLSLLLLGKQQYGKKLTFCLTSYTFKRFYGKPSGSPVSGGVLKETYPLSSVSKRVFVTNTVKTLADKSHGLSSTPKFLQQGQCFSSMGLKPSFYTHGEIKTTISPYKVYPQPYKALGNTNNFKKVNSNTSYPDNIHKNFRCSTSLESLFNSKDNVSSENGPIVSSSSVTPSPYCPPSLDPGLYFKAHVIACFILLNKIEKNMGSSILCSSFLYGTPGQNISLLQVLSNIPAFKQKVNMVPYLPENYTTCLTPGIIATNKNIGVNNITFLHESVVCCLLNKIFFVKFKMNKKELTDGHGIHNMTGQKHPDFVRTIQTPLGDVLEAYDQKSSVWGLKSLNHVRVVSDNLGKTLEKAHAKLVEDVTAWQNSQKNNDDAIGQIILDRLELINHNYKQTLDVNSFYTSYNGIRNDFASFFIQHRIPMNIIIFLGMQHFPVNPDHVAFYKYMFQDLYNSANSPVLKFYAEYIKQNNGVFGDSTVFIQAFAKHFEAQWHD